MKKYAAFFLLTVSVVGLAWAGMLTLRMVVGAKSVLSSNASVSLHGKESEDAMQRLRRIDQLLAKLNDRKPLATQIVVAPLAQPVSLPLVAMNPLAAPGVLQAGNVAVVAKPAPIISMVYLSTNMARVVINGKLYGQGDRLSDGGTLLDISLSEVVIGYKGRRKVVVVPRSQVTGSTFRPVIAK